jgi:hypothetical protein
MLLTSTCIIELTSKYIEEKGYFSSDIYLILTNEVEHLTIKELTIDIMNYISQELQKSHKKWYKLNYTSSKMFIKKTVKEYLIKLTYQDFNPYEINSAREYVNLCFRVFSNCTKEQAEYLTTNIMEQTRDIIVSVVDNLICGNICLWNCKEITVVVFDELDEVMIVAERDSAKYKLQINRYCDYIFFHNDHSTMITRQHK